LPTHCDNYLHEEGKLKLRSEAQEDGFHFCGVRDHQVQRVPTIGGERAMEEKMKEVFLHAQAAKTQL